MTHFIHPKYWPSWVGVFFMWAISQLPWRWQMGIGEGIGKLLHSLIKSRRDVCMRNLEIAFPEKNYMQREDLCKAHFISLGKGLMDASFSWWGSPKAILQRSHIDGIENLEAAIACKRPIIFLSTHFTSLEVSGSIIADRLVSCFVFRPHQNTLLNHISIKRREARFGKTIAKDNIRDMVRQLKKGKAVWYAPDQNFQGKGHIMTPFFGIDAPTNPATSRLAKLSDAVVIPIYCTRGEAGYTLHILPTLNNFPSDSVSNDALTINKIIEQQIKAYPEQYLWTHKRYKGCKINNHDIYNS